MYSNFFEAWESLSVVIFRKEAGCSQPHNTGIPEAGESYTKGNSQPYLTPPCPPLRSIGQSGFCSRTVMHSFRFTVECHRRPTVMTGSFNYCETRQLCHNLYIGKKHWEECIQCLIIRFTIFHCCRRLTHTHSSGKTSRVNERYRKFKFLLNEVRPIKRH